MYIKIKIHCTSVKKVNLFSIKKELYVYKSTSLRNSTKHKLYLHYSILEKLQHTTSHYIMLPQSTAYYGILWHATAYKAHQGMSQLEHTTEY